MTVLVAATAAVPVAGAAQNPVWKTPSLRTRLRVTVSSKTITTRTVTARRG